VTSTPFLRGGLKLSNSAHGSKGKRPHSASNNNPIQKRFTTLGAHNLLADQERQLFGYLQQFTATSEDRDLAQILEHLANNPETLIVSNHPCWDENEIGMDKHTELTLNFLRLYSPFVHALELNGFRSWKENRQVLWRQRPVSAHL
jgi:hypothetical protein